jgi:hypothetical protein
MTNEQLQPTPGLSAALRARLSPSSLECLNRVIPMAERYLRRACTSSSGTTIVNAIIRDSAMS